VPDYYAVIGVELPGRRLATKDAGTVVIACGSSAELWRRANHEASAAYNQRGAEFPRPITSTGAEPPEGPLRLSR